MRWRHPSHEVLARWLEEGDPPAVTAHVEGCGRCANRLESIEGGPLAALRPALEDALVVPDELVGRVRTKVAEVRPQAEALRTVLDLFGSGWETMRLLSEGDDDA